MGREGKREEREEPGEAKEGQKHFYLLTEKKRNEKTENILRLFNKHRLRFIIWDCPIRKRWRYENEKKILLHYSVDAQQQIKD